MNLNRELEAPGTVMAVYFLWCVASLLFGWGIALRFPGRVPEMEAAVLGCILFAQFFALRHFYRNKTVRNALIIAAIGFWSLGFLLRRLDITGDASYATFIVVFVGIVIFVRRKG